MNNIGWYKACRLIMGAIAKDGPALKVINWLNLQSSDTVNLSYRLIGKETDTARMTVFEAIERLVKIGAIVVETTGKRTIAKIVTPENFKDNYEKTDRTISGHPTGHPTGQLPDIIGVFLLEARIRINKKRFFVILRMTQRPRQPTKPI